MKSKATCVGIVAGLAAASLGIGLAAQTPDFDAISVRAVKNWNPYRDYGGKQIDPGRFYFQNQTFSDVIMWAWGLSRFELSKQPPWIYHDRFTIEATTAAPASEVQMQAMMRRYLTANLGMRFHFVSTPEDTEDLVVAKGGFKLKPMPAPKGQFRGGDPMSIAEFLYAVEGREKRLVFDKTGLTGYYNIRATFGRTGAMIRKGSDGKPEETYADVLEQYLGLTLRPSRTNVRVLVVDAIQHPAGN